MSRLQLKGDAEARSRPSERRLADHRSMGTHRDIIATKAPEGELQLPHMLPSPERFADACSRLGIDPKSHVVVYDTVGVFSSPRTAFTFKVSSSVLSRCWR